MATDQVAFGKPTKESVPSEEGRKLIRKHATYERMPGNRALAIEIHGRRCGVCNFDFDESYGRGHADGYIQIHHIKPLSAYEGLDVDPETDLVPLCASCHATAHRRRDTVTSIKELKELIEKAKG